MIAAQLADLIGPEQVTADAEGIGRSSLRSLVPEALAGLAGEVLDTPACLVRPRDATDIQK